MIDRQTCLIKQEKLDVLQCREKLSVMRHLVPELSQVEVRCIDACGLCHLLYMASITHNRGLLTTLVERWHSELNTFHLPTGEIGVTLEDVYRILCIPITGELVQYDY